ncbi:MAG: hypothetical protein COU27_02410 [Candidatus Levybacteria bacterium CG10_big_fil_rev_8_21_14_0_10_36_7]|nr:MAG: hypothetical protein COU27_02410 [Candidatus Levybacteria bacterium CG10_big_fil_rev_8_21_14_0_10_36_7]
MEKFSDWIEGLGIVAVFVSRDIYGYSLSTDEEDYSVDRTWETLREKYREFISLYAKKLNKPVAFVFAHGETEYRKGRAFWHIFDGKRRLNLYNWMKKREDDFSAFICISCNTSHVELPCLKKALIVIADDVVQLDRAVYPTKWDIIHPYHEALDCIIEWASVQLKEELQESEEEKNGKQPRKTVVSLGRRLGRTKLSHLPLQFDWRQCSS